MTISILGNPQPDGSGTDVVIATKTFTAQPDAVGDYVFLEASAAAFTAEDRGCRYASASVSFATSTDEGVIMYLRPGVRRFKDLSSDTIAP